MFADRGGADFYRFPRRKLFSDAVSRIGDFEGEAIVSLETPTRMSWFALSNSIGDFPVTSEAGRPRPSAPESGFILEPGSGLSLGYAIVGFQVLHPRRRHGHPRARQPRARCLGGLIMLRRRRTT